MCAVPPSLFESQNLLRKPVKANLSRAFTKFVQQTSVIISSYLMADHYYTGYNGKRMSLMSNLCTVR